MRLFGNAFSPFSRKVAMTLEWKGIEFEFIDGATPATHDELAKLNPRKEVPTLDHDGLIVANSADIVAYLDYVFPEKPVLPVDPAERVAARALERLSDSTVDAIIVDISLWSWANRPDSMPEGMLDAAREDLHRIYAQLEATLADSDYFVGNVLSIADLALFPHLSAVALFRIPIKGADFPQLSAWLERMLSLPLTQNDVARLREYMPHREERGLEMNKIAWRGDRIEWVLARGFHEWLVGEIEADRVIWPI